MLRVMRSRNLAQGPEVEKFENEFSRQLVENRHVVATNSGTSGMHLSLLALGIGRGDEVIVPSFTFAATANSVVLAGARPVFCDVDANSYNVDFRAVEELISPRTRAIMPVHLFGNPAAMESLSKIAERFGLFILEDAAQAHGASIGGQKVGTFGDAAVFSLYPTKNMTSAEGGMAVFPKEGSADHLKLLRNQGMKVRYQNEIVGFNNRMSDVHAAIGRVQLSRLEAWTAKRRKNADFLTRHIEGVTTPFETPNTNHVYHQYTIRVPEDRDGFAQALSKGFGVGSGVYYPVPCHQLPSLRKFATSAGLPETMKAAQEVLSLPVHPSLTRRQLSVIVKAVNTLAAAGG